MTITSPDGQATPADPCDLEAIRSQVYENIDKSDGWSEVIFALIAEVEALRNDRDSWKTVADSYEADRLEQKTETEALQERVAALEAGAREATAKRPTWQCCDPWFDGLLGGLLRRVEAAETHVAALAEVLAFYKADDERSVKGGCLKSVFDRPATAALVATRERAMERARAVQDIRQFIDDFESQFVCWNLMGPREGDEAVQRFVERAAALGKEGP